MNKNFKSLLAIALIIFLIFVGWKSWKSKRKNKNPTITETKTQLVVKKSLQREKPKKQTTKKEEKEKQAMSPASALDVLKTVCDRININSTKGDLQPLVGDIKLILRMAKSEKLGHHLNKLNHLLKQIKIVIEKSPLSPPKKLGDAEQKIITHLTKGLCHQTACEIQKETICQNFSLQNCILARGSPYVCDGIERDCQSPCRDLEAINLKAKKIEMFETARANGYPEPIR